MFITMAKEGSTVGGLMDVIGTCTSMSLQYGVPLITLVDKFRHARFEPSGMTSNLEIPIAKSLIDYIFCWLGCQFIPGYAERNTPNRPAPAPAESKTTTTAKKLVEKTKDLADKISEVKAKAKNNDKINKLRPMLENDFRKDFAADLDRFTETEKELVQVMVKADEDDAQFVKNLSTHFKKFQDDAPACDVCGAITVRNGTCYKCFNCGNSMGCS
jgi:ribonucleoside-diphosphate reductase alpha chain